jgi:hypothetical protein
MPEPLRWSPPITRLGARIFDLRREGHPIIERKVARKSYSEYKLITAIAPVLPLPFQRNSPPKAKRRNKRTPLGLLWLAVQRLTNRE